MPTDYERVKPCTEAQLRMLGELAEPNKNPGNVWYFPQKDLRTLRVLARKGFAKAGPDDYCGAGSHRYGFSITQRGRDELKGKVIW